MRIIAGIAKGRTLVGPKSRSIRPALDKVKGAIFNILFDVSGLSVLDVFAGTGSIGIEALSRGASSCVFVDSSPEALGIIRENLRRTGFEGQTQVMKLELPGGLKRLKASFELIFVDPPYDKDLVNPTLKVLAEENQLAPGGTVVVEHSPREPIASEYKPERTSSTEKTLDARRSGRLDGASGRSAVDQMGVSGGERHRPLTIYDQRKYGQTLITFLCQR